MNCFLQHLFNRADALPNAPKLRVDEFEDRTTPALTGLRGMFLLSSSYFPRPAVAPATPVRPVAPVTPPAPVTQTPDVQNPITVGQGTGTANTGTGGTRFGGTTGIAPGGGTTGAGLGGATETTTGIGGPTPISPVVPPLIPVGSMTETTGTIGLPGAGLTDSSATAGATGVGTATGLNGDNMLGLPSAPTTGIVTPGGSTTRTGLATSPISTLPTTTTVPTLPTSTTASALTNVFPDTSLTGGALTGSPVL